MIGIYSCSLLTTADPCAQVHARVHARTYRRCVFEKCFASLHFTDNVEDLVGSVAVGLTFKDFLTTFRLVCHVLSTNQKRKVPNLRQNTCQLESRITQTLQNANLHMVECSLRKFFCFALLKVIVNLLPVLLFHQRKIKAGLARKVAVSKFS